MRFPWPLAMDAPIIFTLIFYFLLPLTLVPNFLSFCVFLAWTGISFSPSLPVRSCDLVWSVVARTANLLLVLTLKTPSSQFACASPLLFTFFGKFLNSMSIPLYSFLNLWHFYTKCLIGSGDFFHHWKSFLIYWARNFGSIQSIIKVLDVISERFYLTSHVHLFITASCLSVTASWQLHSGVVTGGSVYRCADSIVGRCAVTYIAVTNRWYIHQATVGVWLSITLSI